MSIATLEIPFKGLILTVSVDSFTHGRPAPFAQTPDSPGYDDMGDDEEVEFHIIDVEFDSKEDFIAFFAEDMELDSDLVNSVCEKMRDE